MTIHLPAFQNLKNSFYLRVSHAITYIVPMANTVKYGLSQMEWKGTGNYIYAVSYASRRQYIAPVPLLLS